MNTDTCTLLSSTILLTVFSYPCCELSTFYELVFVQIPLHFSNSFKSAVMSDNDSLPPDNALRMEDIDLPMKLDSSQAADILPLGGSNYAS